MNRLRNQVQLIGHLGQDVKVHEFGNGKKVARASIATKEVFNNKKGERIVETQWHKIIGWGKSAELMESYLKKGKEIAVRGKLTHGKYEDKSGQTKYITEIVVNELLLMN